MGRHPWVAAGDEQVRFGVQLVARPDEARCLVESGKRVEALGFDGVFVFDHPSVHVDPWVTLGAMAATTTRVRLGSFVNCVPYRHPAYLARLAADLDNLSDGRLLLGLGIGWLEQEFQALDVPFAPGQARRTGLEEALTIIEGVWGPEPFSFSGAQYRVTEMRVEPPPVQRPRPPVVIGGSGERGTLRLVARLADACNLAEPPADTEGGPLVGNGLPILRRKLNALEEHCADVGRPSDEVLRTHFTQMLVLAKSEPSRRAKLEGAPPERSGSPGLRRSGRKAILTGSASGVVEFFQARVEAGFRYFVVQVDAGDRETLEVLARDVVPRVG
ncbi:MAG: LLM class flavin-dependent oxidoreductase [Chloroflexota bacterium]|nr:LLM class flavin-dependent oxidoreductase [Chloroflexota bacterium]